MSNKPVYLRIRSIEIYFLVGLIQSGRVYIRNPDESWSRIEYQFGTGMGGYISRYIESNPHHRYFMRVS
jgi:hypothetical protein